MLNNRSLARTTSRRLYRFAIGAGVLLLLLLATFLAQPQLSLTSAGAQGKSSARDMGLQTGYTFERLTPEPAVLKESAERMELFKQHQAEHPLLPNPGSESPPK